VEWNNDDKINLPQTIMTTKQVEKTHKGLSFPLIFTKLCDFSDLGLMLIAPTDKGKSAILLSQAKQPLQHRTVLKVGVVTFKGLKKIADRLTDNKATIINHDLSRLYTDYLKDVVINVFSQLLYDHALDEMHSAQYDLEIHNAYISFLTGVQPQMYHSISKLATFESMYKTRFIRLFLFCPFGKPQYKKYHPHIKDITWESQAWDLTELKPEFYRNKDYQRLLHLLRWHISEGRGMDYLDRLLKASARYNNRLFVTESDIKYLTLLIPYLAMEKWTSKRMYGAAKPLVFDDDAYTLFYYITERQQVKKTDMRRDFQMSITTINNNLKPLIGVKLIKGKFGTTQFTLHPSFTNRYITPLQSFVEFCGVQPKEQQKITKYGEEK